jgi:hypothetical protein
VSPKRLLTFNELHGVISQKTIILNGIFFLEDIRFLKSVISEVVLNIGKKEN